MTLYHGKLLSFDFDLFVAFDDIADLDIVVRLDIKTAILTHRNLLDIVLETTQRAELTGLPLISNLSLTPLNLCFPVCEMMRFTAKKGCGEYILNNVYKILNLVPDS